MLRVAAWADHDFEVEVHFLVFITFKRNRELGTWLLRVHSQRVGAFKEHFVIDNYAFNNPARFGKSKGEEGCASIRIWHH